MEEDDKNFQQGGGGAAGVWIIFKSRGADGVALRLGDLGGHTPYRKGPRDFTGAGGEMTDGAATA